MVALPATPPPLEQLLRPLYKETQILPGFASASGALGCRQRDGMQKKKKTADGTVGRVREVPIPIRQTCTKLIYS